jgi:regulatory protein
MAAGPSLKARALRYLAAREHSRLELARKLARGGSVARGGAQGSDEDGAARAQEIERVLDELTAKGYLSPERFVESMVHRKAMRFGLGRLAQELRQHGVDEALTQRTLGELRGSELERALAVWRQRFDASPVDARERARQMRFLQGRGFSAEVIRQVMRECEKLTPKHTMD